MAAAPAVPPPEHLALRPGRPALPLAETSVETPAKTPAEPGGASARRAPMARLARFCGNSLAWSLLWIERLLWTLFFAFALLVLALRYAVLPHVENYRGDIENALRRATGLAVSIGEIQAGWDGLRPDLDLRDVKVYDAKGRAALTLPSVSVTLSWWSVPFADLRLHQLSITNADLDIRRDKNGRIAIAGLELNDAPDSDQMSDWILGQRRIVIRESRLRWNDEKRKAPELVLAGIQLIAVNHGDRHRIALTGMPPAALGGMLDLRADLHGATLNDLPSWRGELYADLARIDLAAWRQWLDYPADVKTGRGSLRTWIGFEGQRLARFTADVGLTETAVRLRRDLPVLELSNVSGRIGARELVSKGAGFAFLRFGAKRVSGFEVSGRSVALTTNDGVKLAPADFTMRTLAPHDGVPGEISLAANALDLEPVVKIAELLPFDQPLRKLLADLDPRGALYDFVLTYKGDFATPAAFSARGRYDKLSLNAYQKIPGFSNLSGTIDATEKGGSLTLAALGGAVLLPQVFEAPVLALDTLDAQLSWGFPNQRLELKVDKAAFANTEAAGSATATYRAVPDTPGHLDLSGKLTRLDATATHRYLPLALSKDLREYIQHAVEAGRSDDVRFKLKGNLYDFPFADAKQGEFQIAAKVEGGRIWYADAWPRIEEFNGDLVFERNGMHFRGAQSGAVFGAKLGKVEIHIPDFAARPALVNINGAAEGPVTDFLKFIEKSPVDSYIDGFTESMRADGRGRLTLALTLPLGALEQTRVTGQFQFINNQILIDDGLPQLSRVNGVLGFGERGIDFRNIRGEGLGGAFTVNGGTGPDGTMAIATAGNFTIPGVAAWLNDPVFASMSGGSTWRGAINIRKKTGEVTVESSLAGVTIDLPAPLNKPAADAWPMRFVKAAVPGAAPGAAEDEWNFTIARVLTARLQRRAENGTLRIVRGAAGINDALPALPRAGMAVNVSAPLIDVDDWRRRALEGLPPAGARPGGAVRAPGTGGAVTAATVAASGATAGTTAATPATAVATTGLASSGASGLPAPFQIQARADVLAAFGRTLTQARINLSQDASSWVAAIASNEANGTVAFRPATPSTQGRFAANLRNLMIPASGARLDDTPMDRIGDDIPAINLVVDEFQIGDKKLGKLDFRANNIAGEWRIQQINLANEDGVLAGTGVWRRLAAGAARRQIQLDFTLDATDAGKLLDRLGFANTVRAGNGYIRGGINWDGSPLSIDYASLRGDLELRVEKGQFLKVEPGAGKLLGIMSLQALPRRLTLDFRDVFSEGFAFDLVSASSKIERGVLSTNDFRMNSVSAVVLMTGDTDLEKETQNLKVVVLPDVGGGMPSLLGALIGVINPVSALVSYLAQRALKDPLSRAFSFEYAVTGAWADPKVARVQRAAQQAQEPGQAVPAPGATGETARPGS